MKPADDAGVLIVDDRPENLLAVEAVLEPLGVRTVRAASGDAALKRLLVEEFAVILLDVQMPGLDGFETAKQIKQRERTRDVPIIFLTAIARGTERTLQGYSTGAVDYLFKPVDPDILRAKVAVFIELARQHRLLRLQGELLEAQAEELKRSNADLEQFCSVASHDLQEPLRVVAGYLELLQRVATGLDETSRRWIDQAAASVERMSLLIHDILEYSRVGELGEPAQPCDLNACVARAVDSLGIGVQVNDMRLDVAELPMVLGREPELGQLFQNLLANAMKFRGESDLVVSVGAQREGPRWLISVCDNGIGVDEADADRIFGMFERAGRSGRQPGKGIGLAICKKIVERAGGRIWAEPVDGTGLAVRFTLPAV